MTHPRLFLSQFFNGTIWRLEIDELSNNMVLELRNGQDKQASFSSVNLQSGIINFAGYHTAERWLTGVECISDSVMLLHYYKHESGPEHKGLIAVDAVTRAELWNNYNLAFERLTVNGPVVYNTGIRPKRLMVVDIKTGETIHGYTEADYDAVNNITLPEITTEELLLPGIQLNQPAGNLAYCLDYNNCRIVSLHAFDGGKLQQHIYVFQDEAIIYHDLLNSDIQKLQPEAFVLHKNRLVYIKNRSEIKVLSL